MSLHVGIRGPGHISRVWTSGGVIPGANPTDLSGTGVTAFAHYHPNTGASTVDGNGRLTSANDIVGSCHLTPMSSGGFYEKNEATEWGGSYARKFWRATQSGVPSGQVNTGMDCVSGWTNPIGITRDFAIFIVGRARRANAGSIFGLGSNAVPINTNGILFQGASAALTPGFRATNIDFNTNAAGLQNKYNFMPGAQMQVIGLVSRTAANGSAALFVNDKTSTFSGTAPLLFNNSTALADGFYLPPSQWDYYEIILVRGLVTNTQAQAVMAALMDNYDVVPTTDQLILVGDSITASTFVVTDTGRGYAGLMTNPGLATTLPNSLRVINHGIAGDRIDPQKLAERDLADGVFQSAKMFPSGKNTIQLQIGINDLLSGGADAATVRARMVGLLQTTVAGNVGGYLDKGWSVILMTNISNGQATPQGHVVTLRSEYTSSQFKTDVLANTGQAYDGKLTVVELHNVSIGGSTPFLSTAVAPYYTPPDATHPNDAGYQAMTFGGDTPQYGYYYSALNIAA